jgi:hypothetical protein
MMAGTPAVVQGIYTQAEKEIQGITSGYTQAMKDKMTAEQAKEADFAKSQGAPATPPAVDAGALADTLYHGGAGIPGSSLVSQGATAATLAASQPAILASGSIQAVKSAAAEGEQSLLDLAAKRPELRTQILDELYKREDAKFSNRLQGRQVKVQEDAQKLYKSQFDETGRHHRATETAAEKRYRLASAKAEADYKLKVSKYQTDLDKAAAEGRQPDAALSGKYGYIVDKNGRPILGPRGNRINVAKTPAQKAAAKKKPAGTADERHPYQAATKGAAKDLADNKASSSGGRTFKEEVTYLMSAHGLSRKRARQAAIAAGWKPKGTAGNPKPNQPLYTP